MRRAQIAGSHADALAEGFARQLARWARREGAGADAARTAAIAGAAVSRAVSAGHVCTTLDHLAAASPDAGSAASLAALLRASRVVGSAAQPHAMPLVVDDDGRLYLHRYFDYERRLAHRLLRAAHAPPRTIDAATVQLLHTLFEANAKTLGRGVDRQQLAAALALRSRLAVISGGPGTGKTTTVVALLACLVARDPGCRIALAAPTGKAAARMADAIRARAAALPEEIAARLPADASTVHRLLGVRAEGGFVHDAGNPLAIDALVVDEASMLDLALATRLLDAVPDAAQIVLLGDKDQLAAVEAGAVFAELSAGHGLSASCRDALAQACGIAVERIDVPAASGPIGDAVVWFERNFRFAADSGIGRLACDINAGRADEALAWLAAGADPSVNWLDDAQSALADSTWHRIAAGCAPYLDAVRRDPADRAGIAAAFDAFRVLCALREGPRGAAGINQRLTRHARDALGLAADVRSPWFAGRPVMVARNDAVARLFNGDIGIALPDERGELQVWFAERERGFRPIAPVRMPPHETAFATTVHKAQGSEFDSVLVVLPARPSAVATRELLYTAVTRARRQVSIAGSAEAIAAAIAAPTRRRSGLRARLCEARSRSGQLVDGRQTGS